MNRPVPEATPRPGLSGTANTTSLHPSATPPPSIPDHDLLRRIGEGSYGEVWLARNKLGTLRAVKVVYRRTFEDARPFEREFRGIQKFEPISRSHEGLVDILQVGGTEEYFYYVMELADSVSSNPCSVISNRPSDLSQTSGDPPPLNTDLLITDYRPLTLRELLKQHGRLPLSQCLEIGRHLASALAHLHAQGLVHR